MRRSVTTRVGSDRVDTGSCFGFPYELREGLAELTLIDSERTTPSTRIRQVMHDEFQASPDVPRFAASEDWN